MPPRVPTGAAACLLTLVALAAFPPARARAADGLGPLRARLERDSASVVATIDRGQPDSALAVARAVGASFARVTDPAFAARTTLFYPGILIRLARAREALPGVLEGGRLAAASGDTAVWMLSLRMEAVVRNYLGDYARGQALARRWNALALASGNIEYQGFAATMMGWFAAQRADFVTARRELERALPLFERVPASVGLPYTLNVLANVVSAQGDYVRARELYTRQLALGTASGNEAVRIMALENLAHVESRIGDPMLALSRWREALALRKARHETGSWLVDADNVVEELLALGRTEEAGRLAEEAVAIAERESLGMEVSWQRSMLGDACWAQGRHARAKQMWRSVLASPLAEDAQPRAAAAAGLIEALVEEDSTAAALALARAMRPAPGAGVQQQTIAQLVSLHARLLTDTGHPVEAAALARPLAEQTEASGDLEWALALWTQVVRAERRAGHAGGAGRAIDRATAVWERSRSRTSDPEFREVRGEQAHTLMIEAVSEAIARAPGGADSAVAPFAILQRFKTRTLLEHLVGPGAPAAPPPAWLDSPPASLDRFQRETLAPDELFLEFAVGRETTFVFAVTRDERRVLHAPGGSALAPALAVLAESATPERHAGGGARALAAARVGGDLLRGLGDLLGSHPALIVAPDGPLYRSPVGAWIPPGGGAPLLATHRLAIVPSATVLALLRSRPGPSGGRMLAMAGAPEQGRAVLPGARREVGDLGRNYRDVDTWLASGGAAAPLTPERLGRYRALHFAGHSRVDEQRPWRSGLLIGRDAAGGDSLLTADRIAGSRLGARLVVLSSCRSGGGRVREGEGVAGLACAFLSAGSRAVVASLWAVEDRSTERLMHRFYAGLARGRTADLALREAQAALRSDPATADPFYWAGFVLVGDGRATLPLSRRVPAGGPGVMLLALCLLAAAAAATIGWRRGRPR